jgi:hypothetical protein
MLPGSIALVSSCILRMALGEAMFYDVSLRTEARARTRAAVSGVLGEAEVDPGVGLSLLDRRLDLAAAYSPRLMVQEQVGGLQILHRASLGGTWLADRNWRAIAATQGSYGTNDLLSVSQGTAAGSSSGGTGGRTGPPVPQIVQPIPRLTTIKYASGEASLGVDGTPAARYHASARITGFVEGGADRAAQASLPLQRGGRLAGELDFTASQSDILASRLALTVSGFSSDQVEGLGLLTETWRHALTPDAQVWLGVGPTVTATHALGATTWQVGVGGEAGARDLLFHSLAAALTLGAAPVVDRVTGAVYERADGTMTVTWEPIPRWAFGAMASGGIVTQGGQAGDKIAAADVHAAWVPSPAWEVALGVRGLSQMPHAAATANLSEWNVYFAVTARDRERL